MPQYLYRYDTHIHTSETSPCGRIKARDLIRLYKKAGYHGLVITDHYCAEFLEVFPLSQLSWREKLERFLTGYRVARKEGRRLGLQVFLGMELRFIESPNDYLVYGIDESFLQEYPEIHKMNISSFRELIDHVSGLKNQKILIYQAHPYRAGMTRANPGLIDGIEVFNGNPRHDSHNDLAYLHATTHNLRMISGSDFHQREDLGKGGILVKEQIKTQEQLVETLTNNELIEIIGAPHVLCS